MEIQGLILPTKHILGALAAALLLGTASSAAAQVISTFSVTLDASDPIWPGGYFSSGQPCSIPVDFGSNRYYETLQVTVTTAGTYHLSDQFNILDSGLGLYSGPFDPLSPSTNC